MTIIGIACIRCFRMFTNTVNKESMRNLIIVRRKNAYHAQFATCQPNILSHSRQANFVFGGPKFWAGGPKFCTGPLIYTLYQAQNFVSSLTWIPQQGHPLTSLVQNRNWKTFGPLLDRRIGDNKGNPSFTGPPKLLQDLVFSTLESP